MQEKSRVPNSDRTERTKSALRKAARQLFVENGFAGTSTNAIVKKAEVTRGALYHHYGDKADLLVEILDEDLAAIAAEIETASAESSSIVDGLKRGSDGFIEAMSKQGRARLILVEAPAIIGPQAVTDLEDRHTRRSLKQALAAGMQEGLLVSLDLDTTLNLLSAMFDRAALDVDAGSDADAVKKAINTIIDGLVLN